MKKIIIMVVLLLVSVSSIFAIDFYQDEVEGETVLVARIFNADVRVKDYEYFTFYYGEKNVFVNQAELIRLEDTVRMNEAVILLFRDMQKKHPDADFSDSIIAIMNENLGLSTMEYRLAELAKQ